MKTSRILKFTTLIVLMTYISKSSAQVTGIAINDNNATADASAMLDINVNTATAKKGMLIPRVTTTQRDAITTPATSLLVYNTTNTRFEYYTGSSWQPLVSSSSSGWGLTGNSGTSPGTNFVGTTDGQALVFKVNGTQAGYLGLSGSSLATSLGVSSNAGFKSTALGAGATATANNEAVAIGNSATGSGYQSVAVGASSQSTNNQNIAIGYDAQATAYQSIAIGASSRTTSSNNGTIAIGVSASSLGYQSTALGNAASANNSNSMALGNGASVSNDNYISIGNSSIQAIRGQVNFTTYSDGRFKRNIHTDVPGLKFITKLRPVTYNWNIHSLNSYTMAGKNYKVQNASYNETVERAIAEKEKIKYTGFIAQEVEQAANEAGYNFSGVLKPKDGHDIYSLSYAEFVVPLVKAAQELNAKNEKLSKKIDEQQRMIVELSHRLERLENKK